MAITNETYVDGIAISKDNKLVLLISDDLSWESEYEHLLMLQKKINLYLEFCEKKQYEKVYPTRVFDSAIFEIYFAYEPTENAKNFLSIVQSKLSIEGISIVVYVDEMKYW